MIQENLFRLVWLFVRLSHSIKRLLTYLLTYLLTLLAFAHRSCVLYAFASCSLYACISVKIVTSNLYRKFTGLARFTVCRVFSYTIGRSMSRLGYRVVSLCAD